jgi:hypothetical protein
MNRESLLSAITTLLLVSIFAALPLFASPYQLGDDDILIPVASRTAGAHGSVWQTDLAVANVSRDVTADVVLTFTSDGVEKVVSLTLESRQSRIFVDVVGTTFALADSIGSIRVTSATPEARLTAHARIYNTANEVGEFGQTVPGVAVEALTSEHWMTGLSGIGGNRTNIGLANPWDAENVVHVGLFDGEGQRRGSLYMAVGPRQVMQINDVFSRFPGVGLLSEATISVASAFSMYAYASVVRNDSGDAHFIAGSGWVRGRDPLLPLCSSPRPVHITPAVGTPAPGWIVKLMGPVDQTVAVTNELAERYGFTPFGVYDQLGMFAALLSNEQLAALRCDPAVDFLSENSVGIVP